MFNRDEIDGTADVYDSRDIIARIEDLESRALDDEQSARLAELNALSSPSDAEADERSELESSGLTADESDELAQLLALQDEASGSPDWEYGETLISVDYFVQYIEELINDCYEMPKDLTSGQWPWLHISIDYAAAASEAEQDYMLVSMFGRDFWIRA